MKWETSQLHLHAAKAVEDLSDSGRLKRKPLVSTEEVKREDSPLIKQGEYQGCLQKQTLQETDTELSVDKRSGTKDEKQPDSHEHVSAPFKTMGQLEAADYTDNPSTLVSMLPRSVQRLQAECNFSQVQTIIGNADSHNWKQSERLPSIVESDNASILGHCEQKLIFLNSQTDQKANSNYEPEVKSSSRVADEEKALLPVGQDTTQQATVISDEDHLDIPYIDDDDNIEAFDVRGSSPDCSDESSLDESNEEGTRFENTDPASSIFCPKWEVSGVFGCKGGILHKFDSDVQLLIPPGAIKSGTTVKVYAAVNADLEHIFGKLKGKLKKEEVIVTPAAEYRVEKDWKFEQPVTVILPHILPSDYTADDVRVYHITRDDNGGVLLAAIPNRDSPRPKGGDCNVSTSSFCVNRDYFTVQTDHFSSILCTHCSKKGKVKRHPELFIRGCGTFADCGPCQAINLRVLIWDKRLHIKDFMMQQHGIKIEKYQEPVCIRSSSKIKESLGLRVVRSKHHPELRHCKDAEEQTISPEQMTFDLKNKFGCQKCIKKGKNRLIQHQWSMELPQNSPKIDQIYIHVVVSMEPILSNEDKTSVSLMLEKKRKVVGTPAEQPSDGETTYKYVSKAIVRAVASGLGRDGSKIFFLSLGLSDNQFEEVNVKNISLCDKNLELLQRWCQSQQARDGSAVRLLKESLQEHDRSDLAEIVAQCETSNTFVDKD